jgi:predicted DNA-binding protein with PD1-like motif
MFFQKQENKYILRLEKGEKLNKSLSSFAKSQKISSAFYYGIGAITDVELGFFLLEKKEYKKRNFNDFYELINLMGNLTFVDNTPFPHGHVTMGTKDFQTIAGHLFEATISVTAEIIIFDLPKTIKREFDPSVGLNLISLSEKID